MTRRLYHEDAYQTSFTARVTAAGADENGNWLALDQSAFYPTSGGQPYDTGTLAFAGGTAKVTNVLADDNGQVRHYTDAPIPVGETVQGSIDWPRRFDHMQQHLGEHLLAGTIARMAQGFTIGLRIGAEDATIDVTLPGGKTDLPEDIWQEIEETVNRQITENLTVRCWFPDDNELERLPLRKDPTVQEHVRIVAAGDVEMVACGGTHPNTTGQVGLLKVLFAQPARGKMRVHFVCGTRSLHVFRTAYNAAQATGALLSAPMEEVPEAVQRLKERLSQSEGTLNRLRRETELAQLQAQFDQIKPDPTGVRVLAHLLPDGDMETLSTLAGDLTAQSGAVILLAGTAGERPAYVLARAGDVQHDMNALLKAAGIRGGGKPDFARGSGEAGSDPEELLKQIVQSIAAIATESGEKP